MNLDIISSLIFVSLFLIWGIFFREKIGYIAPNVLYSKYRSTPARVWILWLLRALIVATLIAIVIGFGHLVEVTRTEPIRQRILILLDISRSMLAEDIVPSRIEAAKSTINRFVQERGEDDFGMIIFAGKPFVSIPFSEDTRGIGAVLSGITPYYIRQELPGLSGTAIGDAILLASETLSGSTQMSSVVLITDGRANIGIDPTIAIGALENQQIPLFTIAVGGEGSGTLSYTDPTTGKKVMLYDENGLPLQNDVDEKLLISLSERTGGASFRVKNMHELYSYWDAISEKIGKHTHVVSSIVEKTYQLELLILLVVMILIERSVTDRIFYKNKQ